MNIPATEYVTKYLIYCMTIYNLHFSWLPNWCICYFWIKVVNNPKKEKSYLRPIFWMINYSILSFVLRIHSFSSDIHKSQGVFLYWVTHRSTFLCMRTQGDVIVYVTKEVQRAIKENFLANHWKSATHKKQVSKKLTMKGGLKLY